ncbi:MAG: peptidoglycan editing factor PgeF [Bacillota bacterium]
MDEFSQTNLVDHCFSTRRGGYSEGAYQSLNLGLHVADDPATVIKNRKLIADLMSSSIKELVAGEQVHGTNIKIITNEHLGTGAVDYASSVAEVDAMMTDQAGVLLSSYYADCTPLFFLAPEVPAVALAHAGWRGTVNKIGEKTALKMEEVYGAQLENLLVGIGPCIGSCCYEVGKEVIADLSTSFQEWQSLVTEAKNSTWKLDLVQANQIPLEEIGVQSKNIIKSNLCTSCNPDLFYSYRRDNGTTGRMASFIKIR